MPAIMGWAMRDEAEQARAGRHNGAVSFVVRSANPGDVVGIAEVYLDSWRAGYDGLLEQEVLDEEMARRRDHDWHGDIVADTCEVAVAVAAGEILGVVEAADTPSSHRDLPEITMLYVKPAAWGTSVAAALLAAGTDWIAKRGHRAARLRVVEAQTRARRFYEREGWREDEMMPMAHNGKFPLVYYRRDLPQLA